MSALKKFKVISIAPVSAFWIENLELVLKTFFNTVASNTLEVALEKPLDNGRFFTVVDCGNCTRVATMGWLEESTDEPRKLAGNASDPVKPPTNNDEPAPAGNVRDTDVALADFSLKNWKLTVAGAVPTF